MKERALSLSADLYELTMAAAYFDNGMTHESTFELFVRSMPGERGYLIAAGLEQAIEYLSNLSFTPEQVEFLRTHASFRHVSREFFDYLLNFSFTGDVWAIPEGSAAFELEPLLQVRAPVIEAQMAETALLAYINFQTLIASKAARVVTAARDRAVFEFGSRRAHGTEAGLLAARASYIAGCAGTSNVEAGYIFGIPTFGTLAHSYVMSFDDEDEAFRSFLKVFPDTATILVDTYDTLAAVERLAGEAGRTIPAIRLDSGDLLELSTRARHILDAAGKAGTKIFASGDLDEYKIAELIAKGARIDAFGVGTQLATSYDMPALGGIYKLVGQEKGGTSSMRMKLSPEKATYPGAKQVWRLSDKGEYKGDLVALIEEGVPSSGAEGLAYRPLLTQVMKSGEAISGANGDRLSALNSARALAAGELKSLPREVLSLDSFSRYPVRISERLAQEREALRQQIIAARA